MTESTFVNNVYSVCGKVDPAVGIGLAKVAGDETLGLYCAKLEPFKKVGAHYHKKGVETYQIIEGAGEIHIGIPEDNGQVKWKMSVNLKKGDAFTVNAGEVHQLENKGDTELLVVFGCSASHLGEDRTLVEGK